VVGITDTGLFDFDDVSAFVSLDAARYLYNLREGYRRIEIKVKDPYRADKTLKEAKGLLYQKLGLSFSGMTWKEFNRPLFSAIQIEKLVMFVILVLLILLAGFSVAATLILTVLEKTREIGVLRALGATRRGVRNIFLRIGLVVGAIGSLIGSVLGGAVCFLLKLYPLDLPGGGGVYYIEKMPVEPRLFDFVLVVAVTLVICVLAAAYPARIAAKLVPVEALRYE
jgi:lipoprotein-releasing system permease protein